MGTKRVPEIAQPDTNFAALKEKFNNFEQLFLNSAILSKKKVGKHTALPTYRGRWNCRSSFNNHEECWYH